MYDRKQKKSSYVEGNNCKFTYRWVCTQISTTALKIIQLNIYVYLCVCDWLLISVEANTRTLVPMGIFKGTNIMSIFARRESWEYLIKIRIVIHPNAHIPYTLALYLFIYFYLYICLSTHFMAKYFGLFCFRKWIQHLLYKHVGKLIWKDLVRTHMQYYAHICTGMCDVECPFEEAASTKST